MLEKLKPLIVHVIDDLRVGGAEVLLASSLKALSESYDQILITLFEAAPTMLDAEVEPYLLRRYCLDVRSNFGLLGAIVQGRKILKKERPDLVHVHLQRSGLVFKIATPREIPLIYTLHNLYSYDAFGPNSLAVVAEWLTARTHHNLIAVSQAVFDDYRRRVPFCRRHIVINNFVRDEYFAIEAPERNTAQNGALRCVTVGTLKEQKNLSCALRAFAKLKGTQITLDIYGDGPQLASLEQLSQKLGLDNVHFQGRLVRPSEVFPNYEFFISTSRYEGFALAPMEAMAAGIPVVASDIPVFREAFEDSATYFPFDDATALSHKLKQLADSSDWNVRSQKARDRALAVATQRLYISKLMGFYESVQESPL